MRLFVTIMLCWLSQFLGSQTLDVNEFIFTKEDFSTLKVYPIKIVKGLILVEGEVNGNHGYFIVDTGSPEIIINQKYNKRPLTHAEVFGCTIGKKVPLYQNNFDEMTWAGFYIKKGQAFFIDLEHLETYSRVPILGLVGVGSLQEKFIVFDLLQAKMIVPDNAYEFMKDHPPQSEIPFCLQRELPVIELKIEEKSLAFVFDTGSVENLIDEKFFPQQLSDSVVREGLQVQSLDQSTISLNPIFVDHFLLGIVQRNYVSFYLHNLDDLRQAAQLKIDGIVGFELIRDLAFALHYQQKKLYIWEK